ncbi:hypothetical protein Hypma_010213 [Hypsizygus marmoreus]|uniref:Uncharacterized protein n=1 Tax=Hypsizygus marmoreus TaxID=39966 RepID=A0A369JQA9_HYPMA|nr:hypothetical protein Hypma_010213 [Hypsizygus marmoreus]
MSVPFSRIQLAKALLEYDNDPSNPDAPNRSAHESAIFAPLRRNAESRPSLSSRRSDYLGVPVASGGNPNTLTDNRQSRASGVSINTLQNPFGADDHLEEDEEDEEDALEVDLASWGLDAFIPKDKASRNGKGKGKSTDMVSPHSVSSVSAHQPFTSRDAAVTVPRRALGASRSMSVGGNLEYFGTNDGDRLSSLRMDDRRRSIGSPMDDPSAELSMPRRRASSYTALSNPLTSPSQSVPFPTPSIRSVSPNANEDIGFRSSSFGGRFDTNMPPEPRLSLASMDSKVLLKDAEPPLDHRQRTISNATMATALPADDNPFAVRPPSRGSRFDPKVIAHARTVSNASMGSRMLLDNDAMSTRTAQVPDERERRYSTTLDLLRPKVLVMPSPLQPTTPSLPPPNGKVRDGFQLSTDGPPLPPGARSARRASAVLESPPIASNSFTPNAVAGLSLSQLTFRNTLRIGDQRDSYIEGGLPRATQDGEQAILDIEPDEPPIPVTPELEDAFKTSRPAGKLYGKSLIDDLENRKAQMRNKQRVFTGDERPSMMARGSHRSSTLIDPAALQSRPVSQHMPSFESQGSQQALGRRNSANIKPLLNFDEDDKIPTSKSSGAALPGGRSVFGVDTLWEREMVKLREIEAKEKAEAEERRNRGEEEDGTKKKKKHKRKDKSKGILTPDPGSLAAETSPEPRVSMEPPILPDIQRALRRPPPQVPDDESESDQSDDAGPSGMQIVHPTDVNWHADSSDEDDGPRRTTGTGLRFPSKHGRKRTNDSDEDLPLSVAVSRVGLQPSLLRTGDGDSDDERPLSTLLQKKQTSLPPINFDNLLATNEDDDNQPLGLRVSRLAPSMHASNINGDDDDRPLAYHPEQQRRTQYQMMAQQQQQQQLMMQAQMHNSMYFSPPSMMGSPFFGQTMMPMMMQPPMPIPSPPPMHDEAKFGRVDKWRRDVAVEGDV